MVFTERILNLVFPKSCLVCGCSGAYCCEKCYRTFSLLKNQDCPSCRRKNPTGVFCSFACGKDFNFEQLVVCLDYGRNALLRDLLRLFKYNFSKELAENLGRVMKWQFAPFSHNFIDAVLVPVPLHKSRLAYRGFNQAGLLAQYLAGTFSGLTLCDCLIRRERRYEQAKLKREERLKNLDGVMELRTAYKGFLKNKVVVLVDDVATTCSTLNECSRALKNAGASYVCGLVLGRGFAKINA